MYFSVIIFRSICIYCIGKLSLIKYAEHHFLRVSARFSYSCVEPSIYKTVRHSVISVRIRKVSEKSVDDPRLYRRSRRRCENRYYCCKYSCIFFIIYFFFLRCKYKNEYYASNQKHCPYCYKHYLPCLEIVCNYRKSVVKYLKILSCKRRHPV